ncbi:hypothetical protein [Kribbella jejuensis]|uniref:Uncharacterized protein n=1 Tax=Kribbella jejuensis TaxID=236068 RepID=A0A542ESR6_9ACTN|nr:hypothetical protein [Kribbella jejuensis]TQJ18403.1 hypothetical protein FB475_2538 [Kribbella jejuensis]
MSARVSRRRRQVAAGAGVVLGGYLVLVVIALLGGPRIGASFLPLPGAGPQPASPVAAPQPGQVSENVAIPHTTTATPGAPSTVSTPLPTATKPGGAEIPTGSTTTPDAPGTDSTPTPEIAETAIPTTAPATRRPPTADPTVPPTPDPPTADPTTITPTTPPTPTASPTTPPDPGTGGGLTGALTRLLHKLGL